MDEYKLYQQYLGNIPEFLEKYLNLSIFLRLKGISLMCGMDYASKSVYNFRFYISRYDHSLNVALITWELTHDKTKTLAALFHDISSPALSHVIDYMNDDMKVQESTEDKTKEVLTSSSLLQDYLCMDEVKLDDIVNFKRFSVVDLPRPHLCADRLDNIISVNMSWGENLGFLGAKDILDNICLIKNEDGVDEIALSDPDIACILYYYNEVINKLTHTNEDTYMMMLAAKMIKLAISLKLFTYDDLFYKTDLEILDIIDVNKDKVSELNELYNYFKNIKISEIPDLGKVEIKNRTLNPLVGNRRLHN